MSSIVMLLLYVFLCLAEEDLSYALKKQRLAPVKDSKDIITTHNRQIAVQLDDSTGKFNEGTYPDNTTLLYAYPSSPWSSWTMVRVDGTDYCNSSSTLPVTTAFRRISHSGDSSYISGGWTTPEEIDVIQNLMPVYLVYPDTVLGTVSIQYVVTNEGTRTRDVVILLQMDTMIGSNDAAELATSRGYSGIEEGFALSDELGIPPYWLAYESDLGPSGPPDQLIAMGILDGWESTPPDIFMVGGWGNFYDTVFELSPSGLEYYDSAVRLYWYLDSLLPGETRTVTTYYGLGKELRSGRIRLIMEPVNVENCAFTPNPFNALLLFSNSTGMPLDDLTVQC